VHGLARDYVISYSSGCARHVLTARSIPPAPPPTVRTRNEITESSRDMPQIDSATVIHNESASMRPQLARNVPVAVSVEIGAGESDLDLTSLRVSTA
jgi:hypothetical protein